MSIKIRKSAKFAEASEVSKETRRLEKELSAKADELKWRFYHRQARKLGLEERNQRARALVGQADMETQQTLATLVADVYDGRHGRGELRWCSNHYDFYGPVGSKIVRVILIESAEATAEATSRRTLRSGGKAGLAIELNILLSPEELVEKRALKNRNGGHWDDHPYVFFEVILDGTTNEELVEFAKKLLDAGWSMQLILETFPAGFRPEVSVGQVLEYGYADHHSGGIQCQAVVLPTGRLAIITKYEGEHSEMFGSYAPFRLCGVTGNALWRPSLSASGGICRNADELEMPTADELAFLRDGQESFGISFAEIEEAESRPLLESGSDG